MAGEALGELFVLLNLKSSLSKDIKKEASDTTKALDEVDKSVKKLTDKEIKLKSSLAKDIEKDADSVTSDLEEISKAIDEVDNKELSVQSSLAEDITGDVKEADESLQDLSQSIEETNSQELSVQSDLSGINSDITDTTGALEDFAGAIEETNSQEISVQSDLAESISSDVEEATGVLQEFSTAIETANGTDLSIDGSGLSDGIEAGVNESIGLLGSLGTAFDEVTDKYGGLIAGATAISGAIVLLNEKQLTVSESLGKTAVMLRTNEKEMTDYAMSMANAGFPIEDVANTLQVLTRAGMTNRDEMRQVASVMDTLGDATGVPAYKMAEDLIPALKATGIPLSEVGKHTDELYAIWRNNGDISSFSSFIQKSGIDARKAGLSFEDLTKIYIALIQQGIPSRQAIGLISKAVDESTDAAAAGANAHKAFFDSLAKGEGKIDPAKLQKAADAIARTRGEVEQTASVADKHVGAMGTITEFFNELAVGTGGATDALAPFAAGITALGGPITTIMGLKMAGLIGGAGEAAAVAAPEVAALGAAGETAAGGLGVLGGIGAGTLIAGIGAGLAVGMVGVWALVKTGAMQAISDIGRVFESKFPTLFNLLKIPMAPFGLLGSTIIDLVTGQWDKIPEHWNNILGQTFSAPGKILGNVIQHGKDIVTGIVSGITGAAGAVSGAISGIIAFDLAILQKVIGFGTSIVNGLIDGIKGAGGAVSGAISEVLKFNDNVNSKFAEIGTSVVNGIVSGITGAGILISSTIQDSVTSVGVGLSDFIEFGGKIIGSIVEGITSKGPDMVMGLLPAICLPAALILDAQKYGGDIIDKIKEGVLSAPNVIGEALKSILAFGEDLLSDFPGTGEKIIGMIKDGILKAPEVLYNALLEALGPLGNLLPHSPAKEGPLSEEPNFISFLVDPLNAAIDLLKPINGTIGTIFNGIISTITGTKPKVVSESSVMFGSFTEELKKAGANLSPIMEAQLNLMLLSIAAKNPEMSETGQGLLNEFLLQVQQNGGRISPEMIAQLDIALSDMDAKSPDFSVRGQGIIESIIGGINGSLPDLLKTAEGVVSQINSIFGGVKNSEIQPVDKKYTKQADVVNPEKEPLPAPVVTTQYVDPIGSQQSDATLLPSDHNKDIHVVNVDDPGLQINETPNQYTEPIGPVKIKEPDWTDVITNPLNNAIITGQNLFSGFIGGIGNLLPHSLAKEGPLSVAPNWVSILNKPLEDSASKMKDPVITSVNEISNTLQNIARVDITPPVITPKVDPSYREVLKSLTAAIPSSSLRFDTSKYANMSKKDLEKFVDSSDIGKQLFSQFTGRAYEDPGDKVGTTGWGYAVSPQGFDAFDKKLEEFGKWLQTPTTIQTESSGIMPGKKQDAITAINPQQQTGGGSGHTFIMQTGDIIVKAEQDIDMLYRKFEQFVAAQLPGRGILG